MKRVILAAAICRVKVTRMPMSRRTRLALLCCLVLQEAVLLVQYGQVQAPFYPGGYDQVDYLLALARIAAPDSAEGLVAGTMAQGWLLHILAWPILWLDLPPVYAVHLPLLVLEVGLFVVARQNGAAMGWFALGLFFSARAHEAVYGGPADYRHDYLSLILFGATALATYRAVPFRRLGPVLLAGLWGGLAVHWTIQAAPRGIGLRYTFEIEGASEALRVAIDPGKLDLKSNVGAFEAGTL